MLYAAVHLSIHTAIPSLNDYLHTSASGNNSLSCKLLKCSLSGNSRCNGGFKLSSRSEGQLTSICVTHTKDTMESISLMNLLHVFAEMDLPPLDGNTMNISLMVSTKKEPEDTMTIETPRLFKCGVCHYQTRRRFNHQRHMQTHSEMSKEFLCHICGKKFKSEKGLNLHRLNHQGISKFRCNVCKKGFNVNAPFQAHLKMHIVSKSFKCKTCGVKYAHLKDLRNHQRNIHLGIIFSCCLCELTFAKKDTLTDHNQTVHQGRRYVCHKCNKLFKYRSSLAYHRKKNHPDDTV